MRITYDRVKEYCTEVNGVANRLHLVKVYGYWVECIDGVYFLHHENKTLSSGTLKTVFEALKAVNYTLCLMG